MQKLDQHQSPKTYSKNYTEWLTAIAVVEFDIDEGQKVHLIVPDVHLSPEQEKEIAMLSFPDSNSLGEYEGTFKYIFKLRNNCFGYTCFKQRKDPLNPRGYSQKSLVILSFLPFPSFFIKMAEFLVFKTFPNPEELTNNLNKLYQQTQQWPEPTPMQQYILPVLEYELSIEIPNFIINRQEKIDPHNTFTVSFDSEKEFSLEEIVTKESLKRAGRFQEIKLTETFSLRTEILWSIWESVILNKKILFLGNNPYVVSHAVLAAISLINPLIYCGEYSPYVTVFDPSLKHYQEGSEHFIIGATNPLFGKLFNNAVGGDVVMIDLVAGKRVGEKVSSKQKPVPLRDIIIETESEEQKAINESTLRKYFYRLNKSIISQVEQYVNCQKNVIVFLFMKDLKFFNCDDFLNFVKNKKNLDHLEHLYEKKKYLLDFFEKLIETPNFLTFLKSRNINMSYT